MASSSKDRLMMPQGRGTSEKSDSIDRKSRKRNPVARSRRDIELEVKYYCCFTAAAGDESRLVELPATYYWIACEFEVHGTNP
jgi:hypothetical protein